MTLDYMCCVAWTSSVIRPAILYRAYQQVNHNSGKAVGA